MAARTCPGLIRRHWQGALPPLVAVFGVLVGGRILLALAWHRLPAPLPRPLFAALLALDAALAVWQVTGAWHSIRRGYEPVADRLARFTLQVVVLVSLPVMLSGWLDHLARQVPPPVLALAPVVPLPVADGTALMSGDIDYAMLNRFDVTPPASFTTLRLNSTGGSVYAARALAQRVAARGLGTEVLGDCLSACTLVFVAADRRSLGPQGRLGFHAYAILGTIALLDLNAEEARDSAYLKSRGIAPAFIARIAATPSTAMWFPDRATLALARVLPP
ncbi:MAG: hypothetical protein GC186_04965 [Rhodobacteraceae bacterium]|nr:hypothetical protein [Paracoccaceae bacterium]